MSTFEAWKLENIKQALLFSAMEIQKVSKLVLDGKECEWLFLDEKKGF